MSLTAVEIAEVLRELADELTGQPLRQVHQTDEHTLLLSAPREILCLSCHPRASRIHRVGSLQGRVPVRDFALHLRRRLVGARFAGFEQPGGDRLVFLRFAAKEGAPSLCAELTGRHGNVFLLEGETIAGSLLPNRSHKRPLVPGQPYVPLVPRAGLQAATPRFEGLPSTAIADHYDPLLETWHREDLRRQVLTPLQRDLKSRRRLIGRLVKDRQTHGDRLAGQRIGDLLLAQPRQLPKGLEQVSLVDLFAEPQSGEQRSITVTLDPRLTGAQNAQAYYKRASKARRGIAAIDARLPEVQAEIERLEAARERVLAADDDTLARLAAEAAPPAPPRGKSNNKKKDVRPGGRRGARDHRRFVASGGETILVGRSATDNDRLTFTTARGRDVWLHARDVTGAHVVLRSERGEDPPHESLLDAACLAKHYSDARGEIHADVSWTRVKHVRRSGTPGQVYLANARTLRVSADGDRIDRLMARGSASARITAGLDERAPD